MGRLGDVAWPRLSGGVPISFPKRLLFSRGKRRTNAFNKRTWFYYNVAERLLSLTFERPVASSIPALSLFEQAFQAAS